MQTARGDDVLIIGGGHNGLVCAAYLAAAGLKVRVLERRAIVGGAAVTEEFWPGFRNSSLSYTVSLLDPRVIADLRLAAHGLRIVERPYANFLPLADGGAFRHGGAVGRAALHEACPRDAERMADYEAMLERVVQVLRALMDLTPPRFGEPLALGPTGVVPQGCYFVTTAHKDGFDSRYAAIGWICARRILGVGRPIL